MRWGNLKHILYSCNLLLPLALCAAPQERAVTVICSDEKLSEAIDRDISPKFFGFKIINFAEAHQFSLDTRKYAENLQNHPGPLVIVRHKGLRYGLFDDPKLTFARNSLMTEAETLGSMRNTVQGFTGFGDVLATAAFLRRPVLVLWELHAHDRGTVLLSQVKDEFSAADSAQHKLLSKYIPEIQIVGFTVDGNAIKYAAYNDPRGLEGIPKIVSEPDFESLKQYNPPPVTSEEINQFINPKQRLQKIVRKVAIGGAVGAIGIAVGAALGATLRPQQPN